MSSHIETITIPTRPQPDTLVAIFILKQFGRETYPGIVDARVSVVPNPTPKDSTLLLDVGGGELDHHGSDVCATELVIKKLKLEDDKSLRQLVAYARRDDTQGKGTISNDPLDRAFGLSGLVASLNKQFPDNPQYIVDTILPLLAAHHYNTNLQHNVFPKLVTDLKEQQKFHVRTVEQKKKLKVAFVESDETGLPGYLRSNGGGNHRVVVQKRSSGHVNILTKQQPKIDLAELAALLRVQEANAQDLSLTDELALTKPGTHNEVTNWYYDPATNSLLNGGSTPDAVAATAIDWKILQAIVAHALSN